MATASERSGGALQSLARFGFVDLTGTIAKLDELVSLVGDSGRSALAALSKSASPDDALNNIIALARFEISKIRKILSKEESAERLAKLVGASTALNDFL